MTNKCTNCGSDTEIYNTSWCPNCDKPEVETVKILNLIKALRYIEVHYNNPGYKDRVWDGMYEYIPGNDCYFNFWFGEDEDDEPLEDDEKWLQDIKLLQDTFGLGEEIIFHVSW